jgi:hypothetical protein
MRYACWIIKRNYRSERGVYLTRHAITEIINLYIGETQARSDDGITLTGKGEILEINFFQ